MKHLTKLYKQNKVAFYVILILLALVISLPIFVTKLSSKGALSSRPKAKEVPQCELQGDFCRISCTGNYTEVADTLGCTGGQKCCREKTGLPNDRLVYIYQNNIYTSNADSTNEKMIIKAPPAITGSNFSYSDLNVSPDGKKINYFYDQNYDADINHFPFLQKEALYVANIDGSNNKEITNAKETCGLENSIFECFLEDVISWSPDSKKIVFSPAEFPADDEYNNAQRLLIFDIDTREKKVIIEPENQGMKYYTWLPNNQIVYTSVIFRVENNQTEADYVLKKINTDGSGWKILSKGYGGHVIWTNNGNVLSFFKGSGWNIYRTNYNGETVGTITPLLKFVNSPVERDNTIRENRVRENLLNPTSNIWGVSSFKWSPDGNKMVFQLGNYNIYIMDRTGNDLKFLAEGEAASWSSDGQWIVFNYHPNVFKDYPDGLPTSKIQIIKADGSGLRTIKETKGYNYFDVHWIQ